MRTLVQEVSDGDFDLTDEPQCGRPKQCSHGALKTLLESDPGLSIEELSVRHGWTRSTIQRSLHEIDNALSRDNRTRDHRRQFCTPLLSRLHNDPFRAEL